MAELDLAGVLRLAGERQGIITSRLDGVERELAALRAELATQREQRHQLDLQLAAWAPHIKTMADAKDATLSRLGSIALAIVLAAASAGGGFALSRLGGP